MSYMHTYANKKKSLIFLSAISSSDPGAIRTLDPQLRRLLLYPTELRDHPYFLASGHICLKALQNYSFLVVSQNLYATF